MPKAKIGKIQIYYEEYGKGPPLVMILGLGQSIATWGLQVSELSNHFRIIVFDNRDSGKSARCTEAYTTQDMAHDVLGLLDHMEIDRAHLLGTSMGGMIAQQIALLAPERIMSLILASTTTDGGD
ncbi:MAG: alpha/beta hydrolase [Desulfobacterales bacterium]